MISATGAVSPDRPDLPRMVCAVLLMALPLMVSFTQKLTGWVGIAWLVFSILMWRRANAQRPWQQSLANIGTLGMVLFPLLVLFIILAFGGAGANLDNPSRFILLLPVVVVVAGLAPSPKYWFVAQAIGGAVGGVVAIHSVSVGEVSLATGMLDNPNKFAYVTACAALACLAGFRLHASERPPVWLLAGGGLLAVAGLMLSGTRGAWIAFAAALGGWFVLSRSIRWRTRLAMLALVVAGAAGFALFEGKVVQQRWEKTTVELERYFAGDWEESSIGERFELWRGALIMIGEQPLTGIGLNNYNPQLRKLVAQGRLDPQIAHHGHAHNELLMWWATGGIAGAVGVMAALLGPLIYFIRRAAQASTAGAGPGMHEPVRIRRFQASAIAGSLLVTLTLVFSLFDPIFYVQFATLCYVLAVVSLMGLTEASRR